ncbi:hypothetical protein [Raineya orbicola]|jgi:hypothetical protein|uniref:Lantibiotic n=1 Tax=Raineya orbicola TaxID=2016530 RepID=A0A2N3I7N2_9BACT|nr:hypothetical protein [Raineya orbicola]PKQ66308.1 hypothetical protein Rain11_2428 [Raineya orbicola]
MKSQEKNQELTKAVIQLEPIQTKDEVVFGGFTDVLVATFSEGSTTNTNTCSNTNCSGATCRTNKFICISKD